MVWFRILLLLFVFICGALGQTITSIKFEPSFLCSSGFLVTGQDYTVIEYEVSGSNSTYPLNSAFNGPQFYYTSTSSDTISPCSGFDLGSNACTDREGEPNACSCDEITSGSVYRLSYNLTADPIFSKQTVWLMWPGPPPMESEIHTLPEVKEPPPVSPRITVGKDSYQGVHPSNIVTLTEGYSGDVTCRVEGGYPDARNTQLKCGQLVDTGAGHTAVLSFTADQLTRELNGAVCTCTSQHGSRCYSNKETQLTLNVLLDTSAHVESIVNKEDSCNISSIVIGVIAVVIIACLIVVIIFLLKKIRGLKKERLDSQNKVTLESKPQSHQNDDYLVPFEMSTITTPVSASLLPRQGEYETVDNIPTTTDTTPVSASLPPRPGQYETVDDIPTTTDTTPVSASKLPQPRHYETSDDITSATHASAKFTPGTARYETIQDMATTSGTYNSTSRQDVDPLNVYQDLEPNHLTSGDLGSSGPYSNVPGQHEEKLRNPAINYANADMSCLKGNYQNKKVTKQANQNVEMK